MDFQKLFKFLTCIFPTFCSQILGRNNESIEGLVWQTNIYFNVLPVSALNAMLRGINGLSSSGVRWSSFRESGNVVRHSGSTLYLKGMSLTKTPLPNVKHMFEYSNMITN